MMKVAAYPTYDSYRDSGVKWIGEVPEGWNVKRLKHLVRQVSDKVSSKESPLRYIGMENVESWSGHLIDGNAEVEGLAAKFAPNDVIFGKLRPYLAKTTKLHFTGICSTEFIVFRARGGIEPDFLAYLLRSPDFVSYIDSSTYGSKMPRANPNFIANCSIVAPSFPEQRAIAAFLDDKCAKIDEAVRIKEAQIGLLRERRQILIQQAVTRGLNPDAPMKDSGIDWIGQIPAHWEVRRGKHLFREVNERSEEGTEELLSVSHMTGVTSRSEKNVYMFMAEDYSGSKLCKPGDIVINTMWAWMGALGVSDLTGIVSPSYGVYRPLRETSFNRRFLEWLLRTTPFIEQYNRISTGLHSSRLRLYPHMFLGLPIATPTREEQDAIVEFVENEAGKIDSVITIKQAQITTLKEYKTCLINAAVTGKIKVT